MLVTGASGLIGSWLASDLIQKKVNVVALIPEEKRCSELYLSGNHKHLKEWRGQIEDYTELNRLFEHYHFDAVFHLGAQTIVSKALKNPLQTFEANIRGTYYLLELCRQKQPEAAIIIASSDKAYGDQDHLPYVESTPLRGRHPYDVSKSCADLLAQSYYHTYKSKIAVARCGNVYGGGDFNWNRIVPGTIRSLYFKQRPIIRSDGAYLRDYIYVKDVVHAYLSLSEALQNNQSAGEAYNFSYGEPMQVVEIVQRIQKQMKCEHVKPDIQNTARAEIKNQYLDSHKAEENLNWKAHYAFEEGLRETIQWYIDFLKTHPDEISDPNL